VRNIGGRSSADGGLHLKPIGTGVYRGAIGAGARLWLVLSRPPTRGLVLDATADRRSGRGQGPKTGPIAPKLLVPAWRRASWPVRNSPLGAQADASWRERRSSAPNLQRPRRCARSWGGLWSFPGRPAPPLSTGLTGGSPNRHARAVRGGGLPRALFQGPALGRRAGDALPGLFPAPARRARATFHAQVARRAIS